MSMAPNPTTRAGQTDDQPWTQATQERWERRHTEQTMDRRIIEELHAMGLHRIAYAQEAFATSSRSIGPYDAMANHYHRDDAPPETAREMAVQLAHDMLNMYHEHDLDWYDSAPPEQALHGSALCRGCEEHTPLHVLSGGRGRCEDCRTGAGR